MSDPRIDAIQQMRNLANIATNKKPIQKEKSEVSFKDMMKNYLEEANDMQVKADKNIKQIIAGEDIDPHDVMLAVEKANISFDLVMEIRNKMLEAYNTVIKTQV